MLNSQAPTPNPSTNTTAAANARYPHRLSNTSQTVGQLARSDNAILLENALLDTKSALPVIPPELRSTDDPGTYIVQARGPIDATFRAALQQAGASIVSYVPNNAYLVRASASAAQSLAAVAQSVLPYEPYYKLKPSLLHLVMTDKPLPDDTSLNVSLFADARQPTLDEFQKLGVQVVSEDRSPFGPLLRIHPPSDALAALARLPGVQAIEMARPRVHVNDLSRVRVGVSADALGPDNYLGLTGNGATVNVNDTGVDANHPDLGPLGRVFGDVPSSLVDSNGHGTHVAGIIASSGQNSLTVSNAEGSIMPGSGTQFRGMAPRAKIFSIATDTLFGSGTDSYLQETAAKTNAFISNNSWQYFDDTTYDLPAASYDAAVRDAWPERTGSQPIVYVFAAGNSGGGNDQGTGGAADTIGSPGTAKNVITVGAIEADRNITNKTSIKRPTSTNVFQPWAPSTDSSNQVASFSSRGNVGVGIEGDFGRFKPDLVAPGTFIVSTTEKDHWDQKAYYNPTNYHFDFITDQVVETNTLEPYAIFVPENAVQLIIRVFADVDLPIYVKQASTPTTNNYTVLRTNIVSIPPDIATLAPRDTFWNYAIGNPTSNAVTFTIETELVTTNDLGDYLTVLSNMNYSLGPYYRYESGTSMSAADISGMVALMQEYFEQRLFMTNSPALMKALLINGARPVADRYDLQVNTSLNYEGWGLANLPLSIPTNLDFFGNGASMLFFDQSPTNALATNQKRTYTVSVDSAAVDAGLPLRVTLVWTDPPGNPVTGIKLVNDLDLVVSNYDSGDIFLGNDILAGSDFNLPSDTNFVPNVDIINNVENVFLLPPLASKYDITVIGKRVNVNAVTAQTNNVAQDYALVVSCGDGEIINALKLSGGSFSTKNVPNVLYLTNQFSASPDVSGVLVLGQRVGGNPTLIGTNTFLVPGSTNGLITVGVTNQWHFYVLTNEQNYTNAAFVTILPPTLSIPRMGVNDNDVNNATRVEADIELYASTDPDLTNLDVGVLSSAMKSIGRGGSETIITSNAQPGAVYYVGVKSEDHQAAEYGFLGVFSLQPFGTQDSEGNWLIRGLNVPAIIPDGTPEHPGGAYVLAVSPAPIQLRRVIVTNAITHENMGDLFGSLRHGQQFAVLNNHSFPPVTPIPISYTNIYEDNGQKDIVGSRHTDGPGSLRNFVGDYGFGAWILTEVDNAPNHTGRVDTLWIKLEKQQLTDGVNVSILPNSWFFDSIFVPKEATNLTVCMSGNTLPLDLYLRRGDFPTFTDYDKKLSVAPPGGCLSISKYDLPPLRPGLYYVGVFNPNSSAQNVTISAKLDLDLAAIVPIKYTYTGPTLIPDDAVSTTSLFVSNAQKVVSVDVGVRIEHPRVSDLVLHLVSPSGKRVLLFENRGGTTTSGLGGGVLATNVLPTARSGGPDANTNVISVGQNNGILIIDYDFFTIPDDLRVYYDGNRIFDSGLISGAGRFAIDFGPGASTDVTIIMNEGGNSNSNTVWNYTATVVSGNLNYLTFTENTNYARLPIKFAPPPFAGGSFSTNFLLSGFEPPKPGDYVAPSVVDGWNVLTTNEVSVINDPAGAHTGQQYLSLNQGQIGRTLPTTVGHNYTIRSVSKQPTNCIVYSNFVSTAGMSLFGNAAISGTALRLNPAAFGTTGSAWYRRKQQVSGGFDTRFQFQFTDIGALPGTPLGADGITFTLQNMGRASTTFCAPTTPNTHVSVFYNTFLNWPPPCNDFLHCDVSDNSIGIVINDAYLLQRDLYPMGINLKDGLVHSTHITYDGAFMSVWLDNAVVFTNVPVSLATGTDSCGMSWVGFTSASGWAWENQDLLNWTFCENAPTFGADMFIPGELTNNLSSTPNWVTNTLAFSAKQTGTPFDVVSDKCTSGLLVDTFTFSEAGGELYYLPEEPLDAMIGEFARGNWKLEIWDNLAGATTPPPVLDGWQLRFVFENSTAAPIVLQHDVTATNTIPTNQIAYFVVDVPSWARFATNILVSASGPVDLLFNQNIPPGTGGLDYTLLSASTGGTGVPVLSLASVPQLVPGARYYLGVRNTGPVPVTVAVKVDFDVTPLANAIPVNGVMTPGQQPRYFSFDVSTNAVAATFQLTNLTGNVNLVARKGFPFPAPYDYDYGSFNPGTSDEDIFVFTNSTPVPLSSGTWFLGVFDADAVPVSYSIVATEYPYPFAGIITLTNALAYVATNLVTPDTNDYYRYVVTTNAVRVQFEINSPSGDTSLVARKGLPVPNLSRYDYLSANPRANDELIVVYDFSRPVRLTAGDWFLTAVNVSGAPVSYSILATEFPVYGTNIVITNSFASSTNSFCLTWTSIPGIHYYVQGKPDLFTTNWSVVSPTITAGAYLTTYCIPLPSTNHFFRVHEGIVLDDGTATPAVSITGFARLAHGLLLQWNGPVNSRFRVEWAPSLTATNWKPFYSSITSSNGVFYFVDDGSQTGGLDSARFYRLKQLP